MVSNLTFCLFPGLYTVLNVSITKFVILQNFIFLLKTIVFIIQTYVGVVWEQKSYYQVQKREQLVVFKTETLLLCHRNILYLLVLSKT